MTPELDAVIFDTDGVVTRTASVHFAAWKEVFDEYLAVETSAPVHSFSDEDYRQHVDGVSRYDGVERFLASRGIVLPSGSPEDPPGDATICALGNRKDRTFMDHVRRHGVRPFDTTAAFIGRLRAAGIRTAVISASRNCAEVLSAAGVDDLFEVRVDGLDADALAMPGKPDPAVFLEAARRLGVEPGRVAVVEDAAAGVEAGRRGGFGTVVGVDRTSHPESLAVHADMVVADLADVGINQRSLVRLDHPDARTAQLLDARADPDVGRRLEGRQPAVFLDYDGTLASIASRPELAVLSDETRSVLERLARVCPVAIISGRDLDDVRRLVGAEGMWYAGSHGFDIERPDSSRCEIEAGRLSLGALDEAEAELRARVAAIPAAWVERKHFAIAVHHRQTPDEDVPTLEVMVRSVADAHDELRMTGGKRIFELRPAIEWDKGKAVSWVLEEAGLGRPEVLPVYVGDDETDEDAFLAVRARGLAVVVADEDRQTGAHNSLPDPDGVRHFLAWLADRLEVRQQ